MGEDDPTTTSMSFVASLRSRNAIATTPDKEQRDILRQRLGKLLELVPDVLLAEVVSHTVTL